MRTLRFVIIAAITLAACSKGSGVDVKQPDDNWSVMQFNTGMPVGGVEDAKYGKEVWLGVGALSGINGTNANGVAFGHGFEGGAYMLTGQLNIELPEDGTFYQAWLRNDATGDVIQAGRPQPSFGDVRHGLRFESTTDLRAYQTVLVSLEKDDGDPSMGPVVAQGLLKEQKRNK